MKTISDKGIRLFYLYEDLDKLAGSTKNREVVK